MNYLLANRVYLGACIVSFLILLWYVDLWTFELSIAEDDIVMSQEVEVIDNEFRWNNVPTFVNG